MLSRFHFSITGFLLGVIVLAFCGFGLFHLDQFETADEHYWVQDRVGQYWHAMASWKLNKTLINDKPGISVALVSGIALPFFETTAYYTQLPDEKDAQTNHLKPAQIQKLFFAFRLPLILLNALMLVFFFVALRKLFCSKAIALTSVFFIATSPLLIGISQIVNPDALLWSFSFAAILSFLLFLEVSSKKNFFLTAFFFALALLSKYTAMALVPFFFIALLWHYFWNAPQSSAVTALWQHPLLKKLLALGGVFLAAVGIVTLLLPAIFVRPKVLLDLTTSFSSVMPLILLACCGIAALALFVARRFPSSQPVIQKMIVLKGKFIFAFLLFFFLFLLWQRFFHTTTLFDRIPFDVKNIGTDTTGISFFDIILLEYNPLVFSLHPVILFFLLLLWSKYLITRSAKSRSFLVISLLSLPFIIVPFGYALSGTIATIRYLIILYPLAALLAGISMTEFFEWLKAHSTPSFVLAPLAIILVVLISVSTLRIAPYFFNYTNSLLPKDALITDSWGYGGFEAAQYLNSLPESASLTVWSDYAGVCPFIQGRCILGYKFNEKQYHIDYYVISHRGKTNIQPNHTKWLKSNRIHPSTIYANESPVWQISIDGRKENFVKVIKGNE